MNRNRTAILLLSICLLYAVPLEISRSSGTVKGETHGSWLPQVFAQDRTNLIAVHDRNSGQYRKGCTTCHTSVFKDTSLDPAIHGAHLTMRAFVPGSSDNNRCAFCHPTVDLVSGSAGNIRRHTDVTRCAVCHGPSRPAPQLYQSGPSPAQPDGPSLYTLMCSGCHRDLSNSQMRGKTASEIQKAIYENKGGMAPLKVLMKLEIQAIAQALAE